MGNQEPIGETIKSRGVIELVYSSTSGHSKSAATKFQQIIEENNFIAPLINIGDYNHLDLIGHEGTVIFFLSTYGNGDSPQDGESFYQWMPKFKPQQSFSKLKFAIFALGNSSFQNFTGFGVKTRKFLLEGGGNQLFELTRCDANSKDKTVDHVIDGWSKSMLQILVKGSQLKDVPRQSLGSSYTATFDPYNKDFDWQMQAPKIKNVSSQFSNYFNMPKCKVVHIKQMRGDATKDGRSTLWVRVKIDGSFKMSPACNVNIFPLNSNLSQHSEDWAVVRYTEHRGKIPFPPMPLRQIRKIINLKQIASNKQIKNAILLSTCSSSVAASYQKKLKNKEQLKITMEHLIFDLSPKPQFYANVGLNTLRTYTLASWDQNQQELDLCVSLVPKGLTSTYLQTDPFALRISVTPSQFYIPQNRPIVMIANGSGIAPFRSLTQYFSHLPANKRPFLRLYYGIQSKEADYYFKQDWERWQKEKVIEVKVGESRKDPKKKVYVQNLLQEDVEFLHSHIFKKNGVIFVCGGLGMSKDVKDVIFKAVCLECKVPYQAFSLSSSLRQNKTIIQEVFG